MGMTTTRLETALATAIAVVVLALVLVPLGMHAIDHAHPHQAAPARLLGASSTGGARHVA